jgi:hypothetical protein
MSMLAGIGRVRQSSQRNDIGVGGIEEVFAGVLMVDVGTKRKEMVAGVSSDGVSIMVRSSVLLFSEKD